MLPSRKGRGPPLLRGFIAGGNNSILRAAWVVPCLICGTMGIIFFIAILTMSVGPSSSRDAQTHPSRWSDMKTGYRGIADRIGAHRSSHPSPINRPDPLVMQTQIQMPFYTECFQKPNIVAGDIVANGTCQPLHEPQTNSLLFPTPEFRNAESVIMDASRCQFYLNQTDAARAAQAFLEPINIQMRANSTDHDVFLQVFCGLDFSFLKKLTDFVPLVRPVTVLDAGANVGLATVLFAQAIRFNGQVVAVDANPGTMTVMKQNTAYLGDVVLPVEAAIVDAPTAAEKPTLTFVGQSDQYWGFRVQHVDWQHPEKVTYDVPTKSLRELASMTTSGRFDFIKLDVEGEEKQLLKDPSSQEVLCEALCIFMELHERFEPGCVEAFRIFLQKGCGGGQNNFKHITTTGEYMLFCKANASSSVLQHGSTSLT